MLCTSKEEREETEGLEREKGKGKERKLKRKIKGSKGEGKRGKGKRKKGKKRKQVIMGAGCPKTEYKKTQMNKMLFQMITATLKEGMGGKNSSLNTVVELNVLNI